MDANRQRFWLLRGAGAWRPLDAPPATEVDARGALRLRRRRTAAPPAEDLAGADGRLAAVPWTIDRFDTWAFVAADGSVRAAGGAAGDAAIDTGTSPLPRPTGLAAGDDDVLYIAAGGDVRLVDLRRRWAPVQLALADFEAWRLAPRPGGGVVVLDRAGTGLARLRGLPSPLPPGAAFAADVFRPDPEDADPPRLQRLPSAWPADERAVALAVGPDDGIAVLLWLGTDRARLRLFDAAGAPLTTGELRGVRRPWSLAWLDRERLALLASVGPPTPEALAVRLADIADDRVEPAGEIYPLLDHTGGPLLAATAARYPAGDGPRPLTRLSLASYPRTGRAANLGPQALVDGGEDGIEWHRLYIDAVLPAATAIRLELAASDAPLPPGDEGPWYRHDVGGPVAPGVPRAAWLREPSELGFAAGLVPRPAEPDRVGLFTVLIQRHGRTTRVLRGRYLWVRAQFAGDGRTTPELFAVRAYASRFSYSRRYLPALYHEPDPEADEPGEAGGADFLERFLALFESVLTPLEDRIADAHRLVDPRTCPAGGLDWLASFRASPAPAGLPDARRRRLLAHDGELARAEGTLAGFTRHLDLAGDGALARGEVVVVEDFRLRRTLATILGVDLADETDPLLSGLVASGNSIVGDALILGEPIAAEIAALFEDHDAEAAEDDAAATFFDRYAHRVTVLVSATLPDAEIGFIRDAARRAVPAHVQLRIIDAEPHLVVGVASLLGIDTRLGPSPAPSTAEVGRSRLAGGDRLGGEGRLDGRTGESPPAGAPPVARADDVFVPTGADIVLDASGSTAAPGRRLGRFAWRLAPEGEA